MERYRGHLILVKAHQERNTEDWNATTHIQFNEDDPTFRDVEVPWTRFLLSIKNSRGEAST